MKDLYNNKKIIIICIILILAAFLFYLFYSDEVEYEEIGNADFEYLKKYSSNEYIPVYVTEEDMARKYLNNYINNMITDIEVAYEGLNSEYRSKKFTNLDGYKEYVNKFLSLSTFSMEIDKYSVTTLNGYKVFNIYDTNGYQYIFKEYSIMNYEVYLDEDTVDIK